MTTKCIINFRLETCNYYFLGSCCLSLRLQQMLAVGQRLKELKKLCYTIVAANRINMSSMIIRNRTVHSDTDSTQSPSSRHKSAKRILVPKCIIYLFNEDVLLQPSPKPPHHHQQNEEIMTIFWSVSMLNCSIMANHKKSFYKIIPSSKSCPFCWPTPSPHNLCGYKRMWYSRPVSPLLNVFPYSKHLSLKSQ